MIEEIKDKDKLIAIIVSHGFTKEGIHFFTPPEFSQQLAHMNHPAGHRIAPHVHNKVFREVVTTQEVLFIKKGKVKVTFYDDERRHVGSRVLEAGDVILLASGGHGFEMLEPSEMIEVKQGPYVGVHDKSMIQGQGSTTDPSGRNRNG